jgi:hypothetical protein
MKKRVFLLVAVVAMTMAVMAPASAHGFNKGALENRGWSCFDNTADGGAGNHCSRVPIGDYLEGGSGGLFLFVFNGGEGDRLLGIEFLRFTSRDLTQRRCNSEENWGELAPGLYACHRWLPGRAPH